MTIYELLNKDVVVLRFSYDAELHRIERILSIEHPEYASPALFDVDGAISLRNLIRWWTRRSIPASRAQVERLKSALSIDTTLELLEKSFALSLSDRYWVREQGQSLTWADVNFFDNEFSGDLGVYTLDPSSTPVIVNLGNEGFLNPNSSVGGDLPKKWVIDGGVRYLVKNGIQNFGQDIYNEVVATSLHCRLLAESDYVPYELIRLGRDTYCRCPEFLKDDEELVTVDDLLRRHIDDSGYGTYLSTRDALLETGLSADEIDEGLTKLFTCDYVLANSDRHTNNFGVIRDAVTLEYKRLAPIYDSGFCLWCDRRELKYPQDFNYEARPFVNTTDPDRQLRLFDSYAWFDVPALDGWVDEACSILEKDELIPASRIDAIRKELEVRVRTVCQHAERARARL